MNIDPFVERLRNHSDPDIRELVARYEKTQSQMHKIMSISDVYQAQLHDTTLQLERMARSDMLTGLANRRDMTERLAAESARSERHERPFAVILYDIDNFKRINDTWGHKAGDHALVAVAETIRSVIRVSDVCARWGGEEFLVLCTDTDRDQALIVAEKCRCAVEETPVRVKDEEITVTVSGGVCSSEDIRSHVPGGTLKGKTVVDWEQMVLHADTAMYTAKVQQKNKIVAAHGTTR